MLRDKKSKKYEGLYGRDLIKDLKSELGGKFEDGVLALFEPPLDYLCKELREAMKGAGTKESTVIEIVCSQDNKSMTELKKRYNELFKRDLISDIKGDFHGDLEKILVSLCTAARSENKNPNRADCEAKAVQLYEAGAKKCGTDEEIFNKIFAICSREELILISQIYNQKYKKDIISVLKSELTGKTEKAFVAVIYALLSPSEYFATRFYDAMHGAGTRDHDLIRASICRDEIDMPQIKKFYKQLYGKDLVDAIKSETSGDYKKFLVELTSH